MNNLRSQVIQCYKILLKTRNKVFAGDDYALSAAKLRIKEEFLKNKDLTDSAKISELIKLGHSVENELRTTVIQAREVEKGVYRLNITEDTVKHDNFPFNEFAEIPEGGSKRPKCK